MESLVEIMTESKNIAKLMSADSTKYEIFGKNGTETMQAILRFTHDFYVIHIIGINI